MFKGDKKLITITTTQTTKIFKIIITTIAIKFNILTPIYSAYPKYIKKKYIFTMISINIC